MQGGDLLQPEIGDLIRVWAFEVFALSDSGVEFFLGHWAIFHFWFVLEIVFHFSNPCRFGIVISVIFINSSPKSRQLIFRRRDLDLDFLLVQ